MVEAIYIVILVGAGLLVLSAFTSLLTARFGVPLLLIFLCLGLLVGEDGLGGIQFDNAPLAYFVGSVALAVILFDSGFATALSSYRAAAWPALTMATFGVLITAGLMGLAARYLLDLPWTLALLLGAIVSSTDAAAVFLLLRSAGLAIRERVRATLEIESGSNDPMAIFLVVGLIELLQRPDADLTSIFLLDFLRQLGVGAVVGIAGGLAIVQVINRVRLDEGLYPLVALGLALITFAAGSLMGGSGFLAVYLAGLTAGNARIHAAPAIYRFQLGLTWLAQIVMFVTLGLLATPSSFAEVALPATLLGLALIFIARPIAVWTTLLPFHFTAADLAFIAWVGLRGAVSILLAILPILIGHPQSQLLFNVAFMVVLVSLLLQGWTLRPVAKWLGLVVPQRRGPVDRMELALPGEAEVELVTYRIHPQSPVGRGRRLPRWARPSLILREGRPLDIHRARGLRPDDQVYLFAGPAKVPMLDKLFAAEVDLTPEDREFFGDFSLPAETTVASLAEQYNLILAETPGERSLGSLLEEEYGNLCESGDRLRLGPVELVVVETDERGRVTTVGLVLEPPAAKVAAPFLPDRRRILGWMRRLRGRRNDAKDTQPREGGDLSP